jgi:hypothetical protein
MRCGRTVINVFVVLGIGLLCFPLFLLLLPNIEESREKVRLVKAYVDVRQLHESHSQADSLDEDETARTALPETDPWGRPYILTRVDGLALRVSSSGPDGLFSTDCQGDDITSDMPVSPAERIQRRKARQLFTASGVSLGVWIVGSMLYFRVRRSRR